MKPPGAMSVRSLGRAPWPPVSPLSDGGPPDSFATSEPTSHNSSQQQSPHRTAGSDSPSQRYSSDFSAASTPHADQPSALRRVSFLSESPSETLSVDLPPVSQASHPAARVKTSLTIHPTCSKEPGKVFTTVSQRPRQPPRIEAEEGAKAQSKHQYQSDVMSRLSLPKQPRIDLTEQESHPIARHRYSRRPRNSPAARFWADPRLEVPELADNSTVWSVVQLALDISRLPDIPHEDAVAISSYLEMLCFLHHFDSARDDVVQSVASHLDRFATVGHLRPLATIPPPAGSSIAFSIVPSGALAEALDRVETDPPLHRLPFLSPWFAGCEPLGPSFTVHQWVQHLRHDVQLVGGEALQRCLSAAVAPRLGGPVHPPEYPGSQAALSHALLMREILRILRGAESRTESDRWRRRVDEGRRRAATAEGRRRRAQEDAAGRLQLEALVKEEERKASLANWLRVKEADAQLEAAKQALQAEQERQRREEKALLKLRAEAEFDRWLRKTKRNQDEQPKIPKPDNGPRKDSGRKVSTEAAEEAYQRWLRKISDVQIAEEKERHAKAMAEGMEEKVKFQRNQKAFKLWLRRKRAEQDEAKHPQKRLVPWQDPPSGGGLFTLDEQAFDYLYC